MCSDRRSLHRHSIYIAGAGKIQFGTQLQIQNSNQFEFPLEGLRVKEEFKGIREFMRAAPFPIPRRLSHLDRYRHSTVYIYDKREDYQMTKNRFYRFSYLYLRDVAELQGRFESTDILSTWDEDQKVQRRTELYTAAMLARDHNPDLSAEANVAQKNRYRQRFLEAAILDDAHVLEHRMAVLKALERESQHPAPSKHFLELIVALLGFLV